MAESFNPINCRDDEEDESEADEDAEKDELAACTSLLSYSDGCAPDDRMVLFLVNGSSDASKRSRLEAK